MHTFGLFPLIKEFRVLGGGYSSDRISPKLFNCSILRKPFALTNVQNLEIEDPRIPQFMSRILSLTVRSLTLREPKGSRRQSI